MGSAVEQTSINRRRHFRVDLRGRIQAKNRAEAESGVTLVSRGSALQWLSFSLSGCRLKLSEPAPVCSRLLLEFEPLLPIVRAPMTVMGTVVWLHSERRSHYVGVQFDDVAHPLQLKLTELVHQVQRVALRSRRLLEMAQPS